MGDRCGPYGIVEKNVMGADYLDIEAKGVYALLCCYADIDGVCFPGVETICRELRIGERRFRRCLKQLKEYGVVTVERRKTGNLQGRNVYTVTRYGHSRPVQNDMIEGGQIGSIGDGHSRPVQNDRINNTIENITKLTIPEYNSTSVSDPTIFDLTVRVCDLLNRRKSELYEKGRLKTSCGESFIRSFLNAGITSSDILAYAEQLSREGEKGHVDWLALSDHFEHKRVKRG